ncbi:AzlD family protein [Coralliovum pocilloporae]|uniref:AzlD family protein n=1 Tax=Coralliovum pocilloporae TaxID=3066369 RepID=UPI00330724EC
MSADTFAVLVILITAFVTLFTRLVGTELMHFVPLTPRLRAALRSMAVSVLVAIVASNLAAGGLREISAVALAVLVTLLSGNHILAIAAAVVLGASWTSLLG